MSYRCSICTRPVPPGRPELRHLVLRDDGSIARELRVCGGCQQALARGATPTTLCHHHATTAPRAAVPTAGGGFAGQEG